MAIGCDSTASESLVICLRNSTLLANKFSFRSVSQRSAIPFRYIYLYIGCVCSTYYYSHIPIYVHHMEYIFLFFYLYKVFICSVSQRSAIPFRFGHRALPSATKSQIRYFSLLSSLTMCQSATCVNLLTSIHPFIKAQSTNTLVSKLSIQFSTSSSSTLLLC
jgi:hypothetical protein